MQDKLKLIASIFSSTVTEKAEDEDLPALRHGQYYGGIYNGKKYMYSDTMINSLTLEKLEKFIKGQIGYIEKNV